MDEPGPCEIFTLGTGSFVEEPPPFVTENRALQPVTLIVVLLPLRGKDTDEPPPESHEPVLQRDSAALLPAELQ